MYQQFPGLYVFKRSILELFYEKELPELLIERCRPAAILNEIQYMSGSESAAVSVVPPSEVNAITVMFIRGNTLRYGRSWKLLDTPENLRDASRITDLHDWE